MQFEMGEFSYSGIDWLTLIADDIRDEFLKLVLNCYLEQNGLM